MKAVFYSLLFLGLFSCSDNSADNPGTVPEAAVPEVPQVTEPAEEDRTEVITDTKDSHKAPANEAVEDKLLSDIMNLPEVRKLSETVTKKTNGKNRVKTYVSSGPSDDAEYYTITVAEDNSEALATVYTFHVYPDNTMVYDVAQDKEITLKEWRKSLK